MPTPEDNIKKLYQNAQKYFDLPDLETFKTDMRDESKRRRAYDNARVYFDLPDFEQFSSDLGYSKPSTPSQTPAPEPTYDATQLMPKPQGANNNQVPLAPRKSDGAVAYTHTPVGKSIKAEHPDASNIKQPVDETNVQQQDNDFAKRARDRMTMGSFATGGLEHFRQLNDNIAKGNVMFGGTKTGTFTPTDFQKRYTKVGDEVATEYEQREANRKYDDAIAEAQRVDGMEMKSSVQTRLAEIEARIKQRTDEIMRERSAMDGQKKGIARFASSLANSENVYNEDYGALAEDEELSMLWAAKRDCEKSMATLEREEKNPNFIQSLGTSIFSGRNWDFGVSDMLDNTTKARANGMQLSGRLGEAKNLMMQSSYDNDVIQGAFGQNDTFWQRAGDITAHAVPFVAEFALTGGFGSLTKVGTKAGVKTAVALGLNNGASAASRTAYWVVKNTGTLIGDLTASFAMANTSGAARTIADAIDRHEGELVKDEEGNIVFNGGKSWKRSVYEAEVGNMLEYYTEKLGNHLDGITPAFGRFIDERMGASHVSDFLERVSKSQWNKMLAKGGVNEYPSEVIEEEANIILNSLLVGDNSLSDLYDKKTQADILGGMFLSIGAMKTPSIAIAGYDKAQYYRFKHATDKADMVASSRMTEDVWAPLRERIDGTTNQDMKEMYMSIVNDDNLHLDEKNAAIDYINNLMQMRGYNLKTVSDAKDAVNDMDDQAKTEEMNEQSRMGEAYDNGYNSTEEERRDLVVKLSSGNATEEDEKEWEGVVQRIDDEADTRVSMQLERYNTIGHKDGNIRPISLKGEEGTWYLIDGNVEVKDGEVVSGDNSVVVYNEATGEKKIIDPKSDTGIQDVLPVITPEEQNAELDNIRRNYVSNAVDAATGRVDVQPGMRYTLEDGREGVVKVVADGNAVVALGDGNRVNVPIEDMQRRADEERIADYNQRHAEESKEQTADSGFVSGVPEVYEPNMEVVLNDEDGERTVAFMGRVRMENGTFVPDEDGRIVEYYENGEVRHMNVDEFSSKVVAYEAPKAEEPQVDDNHYSKDAVETTEQKPGQEVTAEAEPLPVEETAEGSEEANADAGEDINKGDAEAAEEIKLTTETDIQKDKDGNIIWSSVTPERAHRYIYEETGLERAEGDMLVGAQVDAAKKALDKANKALEKHKNTKTTNIPKYIKDKAALQQKIDDAQGVVDYWNNVKSISDAVNAEIKAREEAEIARQKAEALADKERERFENRLAILEKIGDKSKLIAEAKRIYGDLFYDDMTPSNVSEMVAENLPYGIAWEDLSEERTGLQRELGGNMTRGVGRNVDANFGQYIAKKGEGMPFADAVMAVYQSGDNIPVGADQGRYDDMEIRDAIIDMFLSARTQNDIKNYTVWNRINAAEDAIKYEEQRSLAYAEENARLADIEFNESVAWEEHVKELADLVNGMSESEYIAFMNGFDKETEDYKEYLDDMAKELSAIKETLNIEDNVDRQAESADDARRYEEGSRVGENEENEPERDSRADEQGDQELAEGTRDNGRVVATPAEQYGKESAVGPRGIRAYETTSASNPRDIRQYEGTDSANPRDIRAYDNGDASTPRDIRQYQDAESVMPRDIRAYEGTAGPRDIRAYEGAAGPRDIRAYDEPVSPRDIRAYDRPAGPEYIEKPKSQTIEDLTRMKDENYDEYMDLVRGMSDEELLSIIQEQGSNYRNLYIVEPYYEYDMRHENEYKESYDMTYASISSLEEAENIASRALRMFNNGDYYSNERNEVRGQIDAALDKIEELSREDVGSQKTYEDTIHPADGIYAVGEYYGDNGFRDTARGVRQGYSDAIKDAASIMSEYIPEDAVIVPMPSHDGGTDRLNELCSLIADKTGCEVADVLRGKKRESIYDAKKSGRKVSDSDLEMTASRKLDGKNVIIIDNVVASGATARAAIKALPNASVFALAIDTDAFKNSAKEGSVENPVEAAKEFLGENIYVKYGDYEEDFGGQPVWRVDGINEDGTLSLSRQFVDYDNGNIYDEIPLKRINATASIDEISIVDNQDYQSAIDAKRAIFDLEAMYVGNDVDAYFEKIGEAKNRFKVARKWNADKGAYSLDAFEEKLAELEKDAIEYKAKQEAEQYDRPSRTEEELEVDDRSDVSEQKAEGSVPEVSAEQRMMTEALVNLLNGGGMEASADVEEGQRILDEANGRVQMNAADSKRRKERDAQRNTIAEAISIVTGKPVAEARKELIEAERERREKAKEVYKIILSGEYNDVSLQKIQDFIDHATPNNKYGRRVSERLPQRVERKMLENKRGDEVEALISRVSESSIPANERAREATRGGIAEAKKSLLEKWAKAAGKWHTELSDFTNETEPTGHGNDSDVYPAKDGEHVVKLSRGKNDKRFKSDPDAVTLFNYVFPNSAYRVLGYGDFGKGFVRILEQPIVDFANSTPLTVEERVEYMEKLGFKPINKECTAFSNGELLVADLQKSNIVRDYKGDIRVIDADVKLHTKDVGGNYTYMPVELDLPQGEGLQMHKADESAPVFYSNAYRAVEGIKQEKATPEQWLKMLEKNGGLKAGEYKWIGLSEWLRGQEKKSLTKDEVLDYIAQNKIEIEEVNYGSLEPSEIENNEIMKELQAEFDKLIAEKDGSAPSAFQVMIDRYGDDFDLGFTYDGERLEPVYEYDGLSGYARYLLGIDENPIDDTRLSYTTKGLENRREIALVVPTVEPYNETDDVHFGDAGNGRAVAWVRFGDAYERVIVPAFEPTSDELAELDRLDKEVENAIDRINNGDATDDSAIAYNNAVKARDEYKQELQSKTRPATYKINKVLVIDEIQSQRHQDGREKGYNGEVEAALQAKSDAGQRRRKLLSEHQSDAVEYIKSEEYQNAVKEEQEAEDRLIALAQKGNHVPDAPFEKNWHELAMKRMLRYAAENGYDKVAWTTGKQQSERYNLGGVVDSIYADHDNYDDEPHKYVSVRYNGGDFTFEVDKNGIIEKSESDSTPYDGKHLSEVVGREIADKIINLPQDQNSIEFGKQDFAIGGEGMKGFYDQMLPKFMDKYGKKWGVKTKDVELNLPNEADRVMHSVDVTPEMKESVMDGQPMFFKTEDGEVYGFVLDGKIYIDPRIATAETPIHEYTHLWTAALRKVNPKAWEQMKKVMRKEADLMDYVKKKYPELANNEDALMDEVFAHYSGKRGKERLDAEMKEEMDKANGVLEKAKVATIFGKIKAALDMFWNMARDLFAGSVKGLSKMKAEDFADMAMNDMLNGFNPKKNNGVPAAEQKTMMGMHNISEEKLRKVLKNGGFANPSVAVVDTRKGGHSDYGEITLIPTSSLMLEKQRGRNAGTWMADAWTPTYPHVNIMPGKGTEKAYKQIREEWSASEPNEEIKNKLMSNLRYYVDANDRDHYTHLQYQFLKEKGMQPEVYEKTNDYDKEFFSFLKNLSEETGVPIPELVFSEHGDKVGEEYGKMQAGKALERAKEDTPDDVKKKIVDDFVSKWKDNKSSLGFIVDNVYSLAKRPEKETDANKTFSEAEFTVNTSSELRKEYEQWMSALDERLGMEEKLFAGFTPSGNRRYVANTLENASKLMNKGGQAGNTGWGGIGPFIAKISEQANTLDKMRKNKDKLIGKDQKFLHEEARQHIMDEFFDLSQVLNEGYGRFDSVGEARMEEIAGMKGDIRGYLKREYGVEVSDEWMRRYNDLVNFIRNEYPVFYFETKFNRPVELWEFSNAIVPKDASDDVVEGLKRAGVNVTFYDKEVKGDRERVVNEVADNTGVKFHKADDADLVKPEVREAVEELKEGKSVKAYRAMQMVDGKLYPPMAAVVEGEYVEPTEPGDLHIADERPDLVKNGKFKLNKGNGSSVDAAYNPYFHTSKSPLNDQFSSAWNRPNLVTVEVEIPESELTSGYKAEGAKDSVGETEWKSGPVSGKLAKAGNPRKVILSRYCKVNRVLDNAEVAERIADMLAESGVDGIPFNTVTPSLREALVKVGVKITEPQKGNAGDAARGAYEEWKESALEQKKKQALMEGGRILTLESVAGNTQKGLSSSGEITNISETDQKNVAKTADTMEQKRDAVRDMGERLNTNVRIITDAKELEGATERQKSAKGWYNVRTGEVVVNLANCTSVDDAKATMFHEVVAHKGLRELVGEENYDTFLEEVYNHATEDVRRRIAEKASKHNWDFNKATDEYLGDLAEKGFEDFDKGERSLWEKLKQKVLDAINKFLGALKLPKWVRLGDNELRYMLWKSKNNLNGGGGGGIFEMAEDVAKRAELGLINEATTARVEDKVDESYRNAVESGDMKKVANMVKEAAKKAMPDTKVVDRYGNPKVVYHGTVSEERFSNFNSKYIFLTSKRLLADSYTHKRGALSLNPIQSGRVIPAFVNIEKPLIVDANKRLWRNIEVEWSSTPVTTEQIAEYAMANGYDGVIIKRVRDNMSDDDRSYADDIIAFSSSQVKDAGASYTTKERNYFPWDTYDNLDAEIGATYDDNGNLIPLSERFNSESDDIRFRDGEEEAMGMHERISAVTLALAEKHSDDVRYKNDAIRAISENLADLRKAASLQREFDRTTTKRVGDLARLMLQSGLLVDLGKGDVKRLISDVVNATGKADITKSVNTLMDIMLDSQLRNNKKNLESLEKIKGSKVDAKGVQVQGELDLKGQAILKAFKGGIKLDSDAIDNKIAECEDKIGAGEGVASENASIELEGLMLAKEYVDDIKGKEAELKDLKAELAAIDPNDEMDYESVRQLRASLEDAIRENKAERIESYARLIGSLSGTMKESIENAKAFAEAQKARIEEIHHNANSDLEGKECKEHLLNDNRARGLRKIIDYPLDSLGTFDQMLRFFGNKSANGEGYLYNRFMRGWTDARETEITGKEKRMKALDAKAKELFAEDKVKNFGELRSFVSKLPGATIKMWNGGEMQDTQLNQGNLLYIYMVDKMTDGRMKLRKMGIDEEAVQAIVESLDPRLVELADWMQNEFLVDTRNDYNETHKRIFGAPMKSVDNYFPLKILPRGRAIKSEDLDNQAYNNGISTDTGAIKTRTRNALPLDIINTDALKVVLDHIYDMEHWNAFAEFNRDLNTLRTYKKFRARLANMNTIYGKGEDLYDNFNKACQMVAGSYIPKTSKNDGLAVDIAKGAAASAITLRINTALKQLLSAPAFLPEIRLKYMLQAIVNPKEAWNWSMENLPIIRERWASRISGDPRLISSDTDYTVWRNKMFDKATRLGMTPNAFVDALTVCTGAYAVYKSKYDLYKEYGYSDEKADKMAKQDATIIPNESQQSTERPFVAPMQVDKTWLAVSTSLFNSANFSYGRKTIENVIREFKRRQKGNKEESIAFMAKQFVRDGIEEDKARESAEKKYSKEGLRNKANIAVFGYLLGFLWSLGSNAWKYILTDDDDEKERILKQATIEGTLSTVAGLAMGNATRTALTMLAMDDFNSKYIEHTHPMMSEFTKIASDVQKEDWYSVLNQTASLVISLGIGVNPRTISDAVFSVVELCGGDPKLANEGLFFAMRVLQVPRSQIKELYFEEAGLSGEEAVKMTPKELAERYARYEVKRGRPFTPWAWDDKEAMGKKKKQALESIKANAEKGGDKDVNEAYKHFETIYNELDQKLKKAEAAKKEGDWDTYDALIEEFDNDERSNIYYTFKYQDKILDDEVKYYMNSYYAVDAAVNYKAISEQKRKMVEILREEEEALSK